MKEKQLAIAKELEKIVRNAKSYKPSGIKTSAGMGEDNDAANLTRPEILRDILKSNWYEGTIYERTKKFDVSDKANGCFMVITKEQSRSIAAGILGGFIAYNVDEGVPVTFTRGAFDQSTLHLNQKGVICRVTNALLQDSLVLEQYLNKGFTEVLKYYVDYEILYGDGSTGCNGILNTGDRATGSYAIGSPITVADLKGMMGVYYGGKKGCWVMSYDMWLEVVDLYSNLLPLRFYKDGSITLFGYPVIVKDNFASRQIVLGDFSQYFFAQKPIREEISEHFYYITNESVFRAIFRINGMPTWYSGITTNDGLTVFPFVVNS